MTQRPKQMMPLIHAIDTAENTVKYLKRVYERLMEDVEYGDPLSMTEEDQQALRLAEISMQTQAKFVKDFSESIEKE